MIYLYFYEVDCTYCVTEDMKDKIIDIMTELTQESYGLKASYIEFPTEKEMNEYVKEYRNNKITNNRESNLS